MPTASYYEILGVARDASHDEVKASYLDLALRFRPDQMADAPADERERARFRREEINAAWAVLRSPAARAHYDDVLAEEAAAGVAGAGGGGTATLAPPMPTIVAKRDAPAALFIPPPDPRRSRAPVRFDEPVDDAAVLDPAEATEVVDSPRRIRWAPLLIGGAVLLVVLVVAGLGARTPDPGLKIETVEKFGVGTCVVVVTDPAIGTPVTGASPPQLLASASCNEPNDGRVVARVDFPLPCPRGRPVVIANVKSLCLEGTAAVTPTTHAARSTR